MIQGEEDSRRRLKLVGFVGSIEGERLLPDGSIEGVDEGVASR